MTALLAVWMFVFGAILASFFGVVIDRVPRGESIVSPPSHCPACGHKLKWYENIPIFSWLFLRGKCKACGEKIGLFWFLYELIGGLSLVLALLAFGVTWETLFVLAIVLILLLIAGYDYKTQTFPDLFWIIFLAFALGLFFFRVFALEADFWDYLIGVAAGFAFFGLIKLVGGAILKRDCLGGGDVLVMGIAGLVLGWINLSLSLLFASLLGLLLEWIPILLGKKERGREIPFCPYLVFGIYLAMLYGTPLMELVVSWVI